MTSPKREAVERLKAAMQTPVSLAIEIVEALRRSQRQRRLMAVAWKNDPGALPIFSAGDAMIALLFASARMHRLKGVSQEGFIEIARLLWQLAADDEEVKVVATPPSETHDRADTSPR